MSGTESWRFKSSVYSKYVLGLELPEGSVLLEYVWVREDGQTMTSMCRRVDSTPDTAAEVPVWKCVDNVDQVEDFILQPVAVYRDPFRRGQHRLVLCQMIDIHGKPAYRNFRPDCVNTMTQPEVVTSEPWFGIEQEYSMVDSNNWPLGWPNYFMPTTETSIKSVGMFEVYGRDLYDAHLCCCMYAGVTISGGNAEVCQGQWEFQVGPSPGLKAADDLWMARYLLRRLGEEFGIAVTFQPKPVGMTSKKYSNGGHINFSTRDMREAGGFDVIKSVMPLLSAADKFLLPLCDAKGGADNLDRLSGEYCTAALGQDFSWGVEDRYATVRIPRKVKTDGKGYFEYRRPASNFDPYLMTSALVKVIVLKKTRLANPYSVTKVSKPCEASSTSSGEC